MKKLSFLLVVLIVVSILGVNTVFANFSYTFTGDIAPSTISSFANYNNSLSNLAYVYGTTAPMKKEIDTAYHVYGTSKINDFSLYKYAFSKDVNEKAFINKTSYTYSVDIYFPAISNKTALHVSEAVISSGTNNISPNVVVMADAYDSSRTFDNTSYIVDNLGYDRWHNVVINMTFDGTTLTKNVYVNGEKKNSSPLTYTVTVPQSTYYMKSNLTLKYLENEIHNFYFDNVKYLADSFVPDEKATITTAVDGVLTVSETTTTDEILLLSDAVSCEVYRPDTGYTLVKDVFKTGDIIKLTTENGTYSYYTINILESSFKVDSIVYPSENINPNDTISTSASLSGGITNSDITLVLCLYKGISIIDMKVSYLPKGTNVSNGLILSPPSITVPDKEGEYIAKVFIFDTFENLNEIPVSE